MSDRHELVKNAILLTINNCRRFMSHEQQADAAATLVLQVLDSITVVVPDEKKTL
jgi:hypothetical protein